MDLSPLLSHHSPAAALAYRGRSAIEARQFLADAAHLAECLPSGMHMLNVCVDRYRFTVGFAPCLMSGRVSLLPSIYTPEVVRQLAQFAPDAFCLTDEVRCRIDLPRFVFDQSFSKRRLRRGAVPFRVPQIPREQLAAIVFTSGSTGAPLPYKKTWGRLARCVRDGAARLALLDANAKFLENILPGDALTVEHTSPANGTIRFTVRIADRPGLVRPGLAGMLSKLPPAGGAHES
jgi:hypothetical protein